MNKILLLGLLLTPTLWAQDGSEEALILNQELQFLEESASTISVQAKNDSTPQERARPIDTSSLEEQYFGSDSEDVIKTKTAAPKRRSY